MIKNLGLRVLGVLLCLIPILLEPVLFFVRQRDNKPWNKGLIGNIIQAYRRYNTYSWLIRIVAILHNPNVTLQYLRILSTKEKAALVPIAREVLIESLIPQHDIYTKTKFHQDRIKAYKENKQVSSDFGPIVVLNSKVQDGHHRLSAMKEAGVKTAWVYDWTPTKTEYLKENLKEDLVAFVDMSKKQKRG